MSSQDERRQLSDPAGRARVDADRQRPRSRIRGGLPVTTEIGLRRLSVHKRVRVPRPRQELWLRLQKSFIKSKLQMRVLRTGSHRRGVVMQEHPRPGPPRGRTPSDVVTRPGDRHASFLAFGPRARTPSQSPLGTSFPENLTTDIADRRHLRVSWCRRAVAAAEDRREV